MVRITILPVAIVVMESWLFYDTCNEMKNWRLAETGMELGTSA